MHRHFLPAVLLMGLSLSSCGTASVEERFIGLLSESICMADEAYKAIEAVKVSSSTGSLLTLREKADDVSKKLDSLKETLFGSEAQLAEARQQLQDKKLVAERAIEAAKKKCAPSQAAIDQAIKDYQ